MSESKLVIPTPKNCSECKLGFLDQSHILNCMEKDLGEISQYTYENTIHPQCPLQPITPNSNVESALEKSLNWVGGSKVRVYIEDSIQYTNEFLRDTPAFMEIKAELSKIPAMKERIEELEGACERLSIQSEKDEDKIFLQESKLNAIKEDYERYCEVALDDENNVHAFVKHVIEILNRSDSNDK